MTDQITEPKSQNNTDAIFRAIIEYKTAHGGNSPTIREIADITGISSTSVVAFHLDKLVRSGHITVDQLKSRMIDVPGGKWVYEGQGVQG